MIRYCENFHIEPFFTHEIGFYEKLKLDVRKYSDIGKVCVMGDLNARTSVRPDYTESSLNFSKYVDTIDNNAEECPFYLCDRNSEDNVFNSSGQKLLDLCKSSDLRIVNGRCGDDSETGTFYSHNGKSLIDYAIAYFTYFLI